MATQTSSWRSPLARWRENPERTAWLMLLGAFALFMLLAITVPLSAIWFLRYATTAQTGVLQPTIGTVLLYAGGDGEPIAVTGLRENIAESDRLVALDDSTQATLSLNSEPTTGETLGSVQIYSGSDLILINGPRAPPPLGTCGVQRITLKLDDGTPDKSHLPCQKGIPHSRAATRPVDSGEGARHRPSPSKREQG